MNGTFLLIVVAMVAIACLAGYLRVALGSKTPRAQIRSVDPSGGFATAEQVRARLSVESVRQAGEQVRPSLPAQQTKSRGRKGLARGSR